MSDSRSSSRNLALAYAAASAADTWLAGRESPSARRARAMTKPALMPLLAARLAGHQDTPLRSTTLAAQGLSWLGDLALMVPTTRAFLGGVGGFALAHTATIAGLRRHRDRSVPVRSRRATRVLAGFGLLAGLPLAYAAGRREASLGAAVGGYAALLVALAAHAAALDPALPAPARRLTAAGTLVFLVSDTTLATEKFAVDRDLPWMRASVMATYTLAQWLLAEGAARA